jgi:hypothetical protein
MHLAFQDSKKYHIDPEEAIQKAYNGVEEALEHLAHDATRLSETTAAKAITDIHHNFPDLLVGTSVHTACPESHSEATRHYDILVRPSGQKEC